MAKAPEQPTIKQVQKRYLEALIEWDKEIAKLQSDAHAQSQAAAVNTEATATPARRSEASTLDEAIAKSARQSFAREAANIEKKTFINWMTHDTAFQRAVHSLVTARGEGKTFDLEGQESSYRHVQSAPSLELEAGSRILRPEKVLMREDQRQEALRKIEEEGSDALPPAINGRQYANGNGSHVASLEARGEPLPAESPSR